MSANKNDSIYLSTKKGNHSSYCPLVRDLNTLSFILESIVWIYYLKGVLFFFIEYLGTK